MNLLHKKLDDSRKAFKTFQEILEEPCSAVTRDAAIQRFEYTVEAIWKCLPVPFYGTGISDGKGRH